MDSVSPPSAPHIVQKGLEETNSLIVSSQAPVISVHIEEVPILEESVPVPLIHTEIAGNTEDIQVVEHPPIV